ncbi:MAG: hypothetical protein MJ093_07700 [Saccharofermentans sp.]|nr:hypothetical protein [Saccharofermentans sp.]
MNKKKITATILAAGMLLSMTGCSEILDKASKKSANQSAFIEAVEEIGFDKHKDKSDDIEDGAYMTVKTKDAFEDFFEDFDFDEPDAKEIDRLTYALKVTKNKETKKKNQFVAFLCEFKDEDEAEDFFDGIIEFYEGTMEEYDGFYNVDYGYDMDDDYLYMAAEDEQGQVRIAVVIDDTSVYYVMCIAYTDDADDYVDLVDDLCDELDFEKPSQYLD